MRFSPSGLVSGILSLSLAALAVVPGRSAPVPAPQGWTLSGGTGRWEAPGPDGVKCLTVTGDGNDANEWRREAPSLKPGRLYRVAFRSRVAPGSGNWVVVSGLNTANRDFAAYPSWQASDFVFTTPDDVSTSYLRFGQWHLSGTAYIADVALSPVVPLYARRGALALGDGEAVRGTAYTFRAPLDGPGSNSARPLVSHSADFNTDRWVIPAGRQVVYRHAIPGARIARARVEVEVRLAEGRACIVEASADGKAWREIGRGAKAGTESFAVSPELLPAPALWVRLRSEAPGAGGFVQVGGYGLTATLDRAPGDLEGATRFLEEGVTDPGLDVRVTDLGTFGVQPPDAARLSLTARDRSDAGPVDVTLSIRRDDGAARTVRATRRLVPGTPVSVVLPYANVPTGHVTARLRVARSGRALYEATTSATIPSYYAADFGYRLPAGAGGDLWWCEDTYKVTPNRPAPAAASDGIRLAAARREREAAQLVLRPRTDLSPVRVSVSDLSGPKGARIASSAFSVREVAYVRVRVPTDASGVPGEWPDPLPPLTGAWRPRPGRNNPLWITVTVPPDAKAGDYRGKVVLTGTDWRREVPLRLHVWDFALPEHTALRSGFGLSGGNIRRYHNLQSDASMARVWDLYMRDFAAHRLNPYNPMDLAPYTVAKSGPDGVSLDFTRFDAAARKYLDGLGFNAFVLRVEGLPSGRAPNADPGSFLGAPAKSPEYDARMARYGAALSDHLKRNGWLKKAYAYWYDEPTVEDYPTVKDGMARLRRYVPGLTRMLTEEFQPDLFGSVDLWCPITPNFSEAPSRSRQKQGEEVWWYVCTGPKEPYAALFIDHPAIDLRMWLWQTWKYGVDGILIWETSWWTSPVQNPGPDVQDPWADPMSYSVDRLPSGGTATWGNGDGRFFYPPRRDPNAANRPEVLDAPIDSIRWEILSEGVEDWDYFHTLRGLVARAEARGIDPVAVARAKGLLSVPESICRDMTHFTADPQRLFRHRAALAHAIEGLSDRLARERGH